MIKERPILFSAQMVRAILDGRKTQTRRVVKPDSYQSKFMDEIFKSNFHPYDFVSRAHPEGTYCKWTCPYGKVGDQLWVRERVSVKNAYDGYNRSTESGFEFEFGCATVIYLADGEEKHFDELKENERGDDEGVQAVRMSKKKSVPSIHMPRWASRIQLEITNTGIERLNDISEDDCFAEGIKYSAPDDDPRCDYFELWESINGKGSWDENPWVWVIEFKRIYN